MRDIFLFAAAVTMACAGCRGPASKAIVLRPPIGAVAVAGDGTEAGQAAAETLAAELRVPVVRSPETDARYVIRVFGDGGTAAWEADENGASVRGGIPGVRRFLLEAVGTVPPMPGDDAAAGAGGEGLRIRCGRSRAGRPGVPVLPAATQADGGDRAAAETAWIRRCGAAVSDGKRTPIRLTRRLLPGDEEELAARIAARRGREAFVDSGDILGPAGYTFREYVAVRVAAGYGGSVADLRDEYCGAFGAAGEAVERHLVRLEDSRGRTRPGGGLPFFRRPAPASEFLDAEGEGLPGEEWVGRAARDLAEGLLLLSGDGADAGARAGVERLAAGLEHARLVARAVRNAREAPRTPEEMAEVLASGDRLRVFRQHAGETVCPPAYLARERAWGDPTACDWAEACEGLTPVSLLNGFLREDPKADEPFANPDAPGVAGPGWVPCPAGVRLPAGSAEEAVVAAAFSGTELGRREHYLVVAGIPGRCEVFLNGEGIARFDGMGGRGPVAFRVAVGDRLRRDGPNVVMLRVRGAGGRGPVAAHPMCLAVPTPDEE